MNEASLTTRTRHQLKIIRVAGHRIPDGARILDLGCGEGDSVRALRAAGYDAHGCDIGLRDTPGAKELIGAGFVKEIPMNPYRLPYDDGEFDVILSSEVLEHVMNYEDFIAESHRVQKEGGISLHIFPGPLTPLEMHVYVPLATVLRSYPWLLFWAFLGIRNEYQKGLNFREVARLNWNFLREHTNYPSTPTVRELFKRKFSRVEFREDIFLKLSVSSRAKLLNRLVTLMPFMLPLYRTLWNRVLLAQR
jgi:SAM-dependent methyltransferase